MQPRQSPLRQPGDPRELWPSHRAAQYLTVSIRTLQTLVASGALVAVRVSARRLAFDPRDLEAYVDERRSAGAKGQRRSPQGQVSPTDANGGRS